MHNRVLNVCHLLHEADTLVVDVGVAMTVAELEQTEGLVPEQVSEAGCEGNHN